MKQQYYASLIVGHCLATEIFIGKLPAIRGVWVIIALIGVHEMCGRIGRMHPNEGLATSLLAHDMATCPCPWIK